jgi:Ser/Thr protein kinase RdoA (MazF antagonist)
MMAAAASRHPFSLLKPNVILDALESVGFVCDGRLLALNSYENRVWQIGTDEAWVVAKFYRPGRWSEAQILEEHAFVAAMRDAELPVVAPLTLNGTTLFAHDGFRFAVYPRQGGRAPEFDDPHVLEWMGRLLARIHQVGEREAFQSRESLDIASFGIEPAGWLRTHASVPPELTDVWNGVVAQSLDGVRDCYARAGKVTSLRLHGDCHAGNVLWTPGEGGGPFFVDFDDARSGPAIQDLWMLLSGDPEDMGRQFAHVLKGYEMFREFDDRELHLIEALRTLRLIHHAAWLARRWDDPAFPAAFPWFVSNRYWEERILELREQIARMQEPALKMNY